MQLTRKFDLYPSLTRRWQLSPYRGPWHWDGGHVCRSVGWRGAAVRGSDDGPAAAAGAREDPRTYRLRPCRRNEPTHRTAREAESQHKEHKKTRQSCKREGKEEEKSSAELKFAAYLRVITKNMFKLRFPKRRAASVPSQVRQTEGEACDRSCISGGECWRF